MPGTKAGLKKQLKQAGFSKVHDKPLSSVKTAELIAFAVQKKVL